MNAEVRQQAAHWLIEFQTDEPDGAARQQFAEWLRASPAHVRAYLELVSLWEDAAGCDTRREVDVDSLIALASGEGSVVSLRPTPSARLPDVARGKSPNRPRAWRRKFGGLAAVAACAGVVAAVGGWYAFHRDPDYTTDVGEQRTIELADGSVAELNAVSQVRVHFTARERTIELLGGQALFRVAPDKSRPFVVMTGDSRVRAVGTEFDVYRKRAGTVVTVLEGRVAVSGLPAGGPGADATLPAGQGVEVAAGEEVTLQGARTSSKKRANIAAAMAWTQQQLTFDSTPLPEVAEEFNRFNTRKLEIASESLADFRISGTFPALDINSLPRLLRFLRSQPGLEVDETDDRIVVTAK
jgi:transmembrane sensor